MSQPVSGCNYVQAMVQQRPVYDNAVHKARPAPRKRKKKRRDGRD